MNDVKIDTFKNRYLILGLFGVVLISSVAFILVRRKNHQTERQEPSSVHFPLPRISSSDFLNTDSKVRYVGSEKCIECHEEYYESYKATKHSRALSEVVPERHPTDAFFEHAASGQRFRVFRNNGQLHHNSSISFVENDQMDLVDYAMKYAVGSGHFGHSYLAEIDGFLVQSPITWYTQRSEWDMSPGFDQPHHMGFRRIISTGCLFCHSGLVETQDRNEYRPIIRELAIGCERCHGPGSLHIKKQSFLQVSEHTERQTIDHTIVNPKYLPRKLNEAVCQQCHLQADVQQTVRGRKHWDFRPGLPLEDFRIEYRLNENTDRMTIVGHVEQLHESRCFKLSETLTCITCHKMHTIGTAAEKQTVYQMTCLKCHGENELTSCDLSITQREEDAQNNCVHCHMPQSSTEIPHVAFTHHRIGIHNTTATTNPDHQLGSLETIQNLSSFSVIERKRMLGLAYLSLYERNGRIPREIAYQKRAMSLLEEVYQAGLKDVAVTGNLAKIAWQNKNVEKATELANLALDSTDSPTDQRINALTVLAEIRFQQQKFLESRKLYRQLAESRRSARHWFYLGLCEQNCRNTEAATFALKHSLEIEPIQTGAHAALASIYHSLGQLKLAEKHRQQAEFLTRFWSRTFPSEQ